MKMNVTKIRSFWTFHVVVMQNNGKEIYKKSMLHVQSCFLAHLGCVFLENPNLEFGIQKRILRFFGQIEKRIMNP